MSERLYRSYRKAIGRQQALIEQWEPVIEAAKAWLHSVSPRDERDHVYCRHRLGEAIEALLAAEGEE